MKKLLTALALSVIVGLSATPPIASAAAPYCGITWGSLPKNATDLAAGESLSNVRTGQQGCYDRMVFDLSAPGTGYSVSYVDNVYAEGSGTLVPLSGGAKLRITLLAPAYSPTTVKPTYNAKAGKALPGVNLKGYNAFRDTKFAGSFEGRTTVGLGVRTRLPFQVSRVDNRVVVDVAHQW
jgi:hypothetical protein